MLSVTTANLRTVSLSQVLGMPIVVTRALDMPVKCATPFSSLHVCVSMWYGRNSTYTLLCVACSKNTDYAAAVPGFSVNCVAISFQPFSVWSSVKLNERVVTRPCALRAKQSNRACVSSSCLNLEQTYTLILNSCLAGCMNIAVVLPMNEITCSVFLS